MMEIYITCLLQILRFSCRVDDLKQEIVFVGQPCWQQYFINGSRPEFFSFLRALSI